MKPAPFAYRRPEGLEEALAILAEHGDETSVLAGGQSLVPVLSLRVARPALVLDINRIAGLDSIERRDGSLVVGALVRQRAALASAHVAEDAPLLAAALPHVGYPETRNRGTVVGSVAHNDPAAEIPAVAVTLDAEVVLRSASAERVVPVAEYLVAPYLTAREPGELVVALRLQIPASPLGWGFAEVARRHHDFALAAAAAGIGLAPDGTVSDARIALAGVGATAFRATAAEALLAGGTPEPALLAEAAARAVEESDPPGDVLASAAYRRHVSRVLVGRVLTQALDRAKGAP
ncbi:MAG TPA: FAD binding domain-containing protein [Gaiellaceae bacterium]|nr:FAD binding domain-containing protein [Gaiellaceae bacterium]